MKLKRIMSVVLAALMMTSAIAVGTITSSAATNIYEEAAHKIDNEFRYDGNDLGATYTPEETTFKVWAPTATKCTLNLYATGSDGEEGAKDLGTSEMTKDEKTGIFSVTVPGDLKNVYYTYTITAKSIATAAVTTKETPDVYSVTTGVNGKRSMVCDLDSTDPEGWENDKHVMTENQSEATIWEIHVKDFSYNSNSGVSEANRGKFTAFTETGTTLNGEGDISTCIDYLKELGVTYVQINPFYDYGSVDESGSDDQFNWGYDPMNYNVPEGSYSSNPYDGDVRIKECKQMIQALHNAGIGVIMDVVYNHTYNTSTSFQACVPDYYYRKTSAGGFSNGSGCGNDTASERAMYRNFMIQSTKYWAEEYHIDGFRFDLMGLHDVYTMNEIRKSLDTISEDMIMYGEGWGMTTVADAVDCDGNEMKMASQASTKYLDERIAMFNDQYRDGMKGSYASAGAKGYIQGNIVGNSKGVKYGIRANTVGSASNWKAYSPAQCVNYVSCHDNNTLYDKLGASIYGDGVEYRAKDKKLVDLNKFAETIGATSQGMHFFLAGEEMARSKDGDHNSYKSPATLNMIDWNDLVKYSDLVSYYKGMLDIRNAFSPFTTDDINVSKKQYLMSGSLISDTNQIAYTVKNTVEGEWDKVAVLMNSDSAPSDISLSFDASVTDDTEWVVIADTVEAGLTPIKVVKGKEITVPASTAMVLVEKNTYDKCAITSDKSKVTIINKDTDSNKVISKQVLYGTKGTKYVTEVDQSLVNQYELLNVVGDVKGEFGDIDKEVVYEFTPYIPSSLRTSLTGKNLSIKDTTLIQKAVAGVVTLTDEQKAIADYNMDGKVDISDGTLVQKKVNHDDLGTVRTLTVRYINSKTQKPIASDKQYKVVAGKSGVYEAPSLIGYKYSHNSVSGESATATVNYTFKDQYILFFYDEDNYTAKVHFKHSGELSWTPYLWTWVIDPSTGTDIDFEVIPGASWPGTALTKDADGWYTAELAIPNGAQYCVIISNNGATQTKDYKGFDAEEMWVTINDSAVSQGGDFLKFSTTNPDA